MPIDSRIDKDRQLVVATASGRVTFAEATDYQDRLLNDPDFNPEFRQLLDGRAVTHLDITVDQAKIVAKRRLFSDSSRRAWVAHERAVFGMGRLIATYNENSPAKSQIKVFYDLPSALHWLGLDGLATIPA